MYSATTPHPLADRSAILISFCLLVRSRAPFFRASWARRSAGESSMVARASCASWTLSYTCVLKCACSSCTFFLNSYGWSCRMRLTAFVSASSCACWTSALKSTSFRSNRCSDSRIAAKRAANCGPGSWLVDRGNRCSDSRIAAKRAANCGPGSWLIGVTGAPTRVLLPRERQTAAQVVG